MHDAVSVDIKGNFDLRYAAGSRRNIAQLEAAQRFIVRSHFAFALEYMNFYRRLIVSRCGENLAFFRRNRRVALDNLGENASKSFDTQRQGRYVQQQHVFYFPCQHARLNSSAYGYALVRVHAAERLFTQEFFDSFLNGRNTSRTANQDNLVDFVYAQSGIGQSLSRGSHGGFH